MERVNFQAIEKKWQKNLRRPSYITRMEKNFIA